MVMDNEQPKQASCKPELELHTFESASHQIMFNQPLTIMTKPSNNRRYVPLLAIILI